MFNFVSGEYSGGDAVFRYYDTDGFLCKVYITTRPKQFTEEWVVTSKRDIEHKFVYREYYVHCFYKMPKYPACSVARICDALLQSSVYCEQFEQLFRASLDIAKYHNTPYRDKAKYNSPSAPYLKEMAKFVFCHETRQPYKPKNSIVEDEFGFVTTYFYSDDYESLCREIEKFE